MSTENVGSSPPSCCSRQPEQGAKSCRCPCRKWVYGGLVLLILVAGGVAWIAYQQMGGSLRNTAPYRVAVQKIQSDPTLRDALGQPISDAWRTAGEPEDMYFDIQGPKGNAKVHAKARLAQGKWDLIQLEVTLEPSGKRVLVPLGEGEEAPPFQASPPAEASKSPAGKPAGAAPADAAKPPANGPGPDIKIDLPATPGGGPGSS